MNHKITKPLTESLIEKILLKKQLKVVLEKEKQYGTYRYFPKNRTALLLCQLTGTKTLNKNQQEILKRMGYTISYSMDDILDHVNDLDCLINH